MIVVYGNCMSHRVNHHRSTKHLHHHTNATMCWDHHLLPLMQIFKAMSVQRIIVNSDSEYSVGK